MSHPSPVAVVIAAFRARSTIGDAVRSALADPIVGEVLVVDDASDDDTVETAETASGGDSRLQIIRQDCNQGPGAARNLAISRSHSPYLAILDSDDLFMPNRFERLLSTPDWDFCADNIVFFSTRDELEGIAATEADEPGRVVQFDFENFVEGNVPSACRPRGEFGFLKPVIRRDFLERHTLSYTEDCRLGEDFLLYTEALACGARFKALSKCGYAALVRKGSISGQHSFQDLENLLRAERDLLERLSLTGSQRSALAKHAKGTSRRSNHRKVLKRKGEAGLIAGLQAAVRCPTSLIDIARDRLTPVRPVGTTPRTLLTDEHFDQMSR